MNMFASFPDLLSMEDMQKALGVGRSLAYRLINAGVVKHLRIGKVIKIPKLFLVDYIMGSCYDDSVAEISPSL